LSLVNIGAQLNELARLIAPVKLRNKFPAFGANGDALFP
jgi:hypothetical protein